MQIELVSVNDGDHPVLENLLQLYAYDFSEILDSDVADNGRFDTITAGDLGGPESPSLSREVGWPSCRLRVRPPRKLLYR